MEARDTDPAEQPAAEQPKRPEPSYRKGMLKAVLMQHTSGIGEGGARTLPRRELTFVMDANACMPGVFPEDFKITIRALAPADEASIIEIARSKGQGGNPVVSQQLAALKMIVAVNGDPVEPGEDEFLWLALDMAGRSIVLRMCEQLSGAGDAMGKAKDSVVVTSR